MIHVTCHVAIIFTKQKVSSLKKCFHSICCLQVRRQSVLDSTLEGWLSESETAAYNEKFVVISSIDVARINKKFS